MFEKSVEELTELGAQITTAEIAQQPELWRDTLNIYRENKEAIEAFLAEARAMGEGRLSVVFTGAAFDRMPCSGTVQRHRLGPFQRETAVAFQKYHTFRGQFAQRLKIGRAHV